ncbi:MAG: hypothetical protein JW959_13035 [Pirellulales bacterium]|nr:hypothetical protein [Pirellulales bacterium]
MRATNRPAQGHGKTHVADWNAPERKECRRLKTSTPLQIELPHQGR